MFSRRLTWIVVGILFLSWFVECPDQAVGQSTALPRHAAFALDPAESNMSFTLFFGTGQSKLAGVVQLYLGDPSVATWDQVGVVGLSVDRADLVALDFVPDLPGITEPLHLIKSPTVRCLGSWNTITGQIGFNLSLVSIGADGKTAGLPVPMPVRVSGMLLDGVLKVDGNNGNVPDGAVRMHIKAFDTSLPPGVIDVWFSTNTGFHPNSVSSAAAVPTLISDGDLLSVRGYVVRSNRQLIGRLGVMPPAPDLGLDAVLPARYGEMWFSFKQSCGQIWSEGLGRWLTDGDVLSDRGYVAIPHEKLLAHFVTMGPMPNVGLDALQRGPNLDILFSTDESFFCESLGRTVGHGDLLSMRGHVVRTNAELLRNFRISDLTMRPIPADYGLDAVILRANGEIWFSTESGFFDQTLGWVGHGDLLSTNGYIVARNRDLVATFQPVEDLDDFGLDALTFSVRSRVGDFDQDGDVDAADVSTFASAISGPAMATDRPEVGDLDGDGDTDQTDFGILQRCFSEAGAIADPECGE